VYSRGAGPDPLTQIRPAELFMHFAWHNGFCLFCRHQTEVAQAGEVLWGSQPVVFEICKVCLFGIFTGIEHRLSGGIPPGYVSRDHN
jgi:hypothetical protein